MKFWEILNQVVLNRRDTFAYVLRRNYGPKALGDFRSYCRDPSNGQVTVKQIPHSAKTAEIRDDNCGGPAGSLGVG
jgi:hypothetical protein